MASSSFLPTTEDKKWKENLATSTLADIEDIGEAENGFCRTHEVDQSCAGRDSFDRHILVPITRGTS